MLRWGPVLKDFMGVDGPIRPPGPSLVWRHDAVRAKDENVSISGERRLDLDAKFFQPDVMALVDEQPAPSLAASFALSGQASAIGSSRTIRRSWRLPSPMA